MLSSSKSSKVVLYVYDIDDTSVIFNKMMISPFILRLQQQEHY